MPKVYRDNPFRVGSGADDLSPDALWQTYLRDPHEYARIRTAHPELPVAPLPSGEGATLTQTDWRPDPVKRLREEIQFVHDQPWPSAIAHTLIDPFGLEFEAGKTAAQTAVGMGLGAYQRVQEARPDVDLGRAISGGIQRLRTEGPAALRDLPGSIGGGTQAFLEGAHRPSRSLPGAEPRTTDTWSTRERPRLDNPFNPAEALQRLDYYAPGPWKDVATLPLMVGMPAGLLGKIPVAGKVLEPAARIISGDAAFTGMGKVAKTGLEAASHALMPGLQIEQPIVGSMSIPSIVKSLRYTNTIPIPKETEIYKPIAGGSPIGPALEKAYSVYNQGKREQQGIATGYGMQRRNPVTGALEIPEDTYRKVIGGQAGLAVDLLRKKLVDGTAPIQSLGAWVDRLLLTTNRKVPNEVKNAYSMLTNMQQANRTASNFHHWALTELKTNFGMKVPGAMDDWYVARNILVQLEKHKQGVGDPGWFGSAGEAAGALAGHYRKVGEKYGLQPDDVRQWFEGASQWYTQEVMNPLLYKLRDSGMLTDERVANAVNKHEHYAVLRNVGTYTDAVGGGRILDHPVTRGIGNFHPATEVAVASLEADTQRIQQVFHAIQRNDAMNLLEKARIEIPELESKGLLTRLAPMGNQYTAEVAKNIGRIPFFHKETKDYLELGADPLIAHAINQANSNQVNAVLRALRLPNQIFQVAVTTMNPTFLLGHLSRTTSSVIENMPEGKAGQAFAHMLWQAPFSMFMHNAGTWLEKHPAEALGIDKRAAEHLLGLAGKDAGEFPLYGPYQQGLTFVGNYGETGARTMLERAGIPMPESLKEKNVLKQAWNVLPFKGIGHFMESAFEFADQMPRFAAYQVLRKEGMAAEEAGQMVTNMGVNFRRSGDLVRQMNAMVPLLNAREQGVLTSMHGLWENPHRFLWRTGWLVGIPEMALYAHNRDVMGDLYNNLDPRTLMGNYVVGTGGVTRDKSGREQPVYFQIPKTPLVQVMTAPLLQFMDATYHHSAGALPEEYKDHFPDHPYFQIPEENRVNQSAQHLLMGMLGRILPTDVSGANTWHELLDPMNILMMQPMLGTATQMWANKDDFTGRPIVPPELDAVPPEYHYTQNTTESAKALSRTLQGTPLAGFMKLQEPAMLEHLVQSYLGGSGMFMLTGADSMWKTLAQHGLIPPPDYAPRSWEDLKLPNTLPEDVKWQLMEELGTPEREPWGQDFLKRIMRFYGTGGAANSDMARASRYGDEAKQVVMDTRGYQTKYARARAAMNETLRKKFADPGNDTPDELRKFENDQYSVLRGRGVELLTEFPRAKLDPREYHAFMDKLPGANLQEMVATLPKLPAGLTPEMITGQLEQTNDPNPLKRYQLQQKALGDMARQYQIPVNVLKDHAGAAIAGRTLPEIPVPNIGIQLARDEYFRPSDIDLSMATPKELAQARDRVVQKYSDEWGVGRKTFLEWMNTSFRDPFASAPMQKSRESASSLAHELYDTERFPAYVTADGQPYGAPEQQKQWDLLLAEYQANKVPRDQWPAAVQGIDAAKRYADVFKDLYIMNDHRYHDYQMWYGMGRNMPVADWARFQNGEIPKYRAGTPQQWPSWDSLQKIYAKLPANDPHKAALQPVVKQIRDLAVPHWQSLLAAEENLGRT